jgi:CRISPR-associated protein Cas1
MVLPFTFEQLWEAWERVCENEGCAGCDGVTVAQFAQRAHRWLPRLIERVEDGSYRPFPLLKIVVEKAPGQAQTRTLLVPTVADRVLQTAVARHLSRSFEEEFLECSYGYRPGRSVDRAIARIRKCRQLGYVYVVDADIHTFFDHVDIDLLLERLAERRPGETIMDLLRQWIRGCVWDGSHLHPLTRGVPQGSPVSPLLANFFLEDFDRELEKSGRKLIRYADDFLILARTPQDASQALAQSEQLLAQEHLKLNREKTRIVDFAHGFRFLGALFERDTIWVPWKNDRVKGRLLFMASPLPLAMRTRFELPTPRGTMEMALVHAGATTTAESVPAGGDERRMNVAYLYLTEQGSILRKAGDRFLIEKDDEVLLDLPYHKLETVLLFGNIQVTTQALAELLEKGVNLSLFSRQGQYRGSLAPPRGRNIELRLAQFDCYRNGARALFMAQSIVQAKIANGLAVLGRYRARGAPQDEGSAEFEAGLKSLEAAVTACGGAQTVAALDGMEGAAAHTYFTLLMEFNKSGMNWPGRQKHPSTDPLNALLSLAYTLLMHELTALAEGAGLDPYLGFLHQVDYGRPSLALDLMEAFRHPVADRLVLTLVNRQVLGGDDFRSGGERPGVFLTPAAMKRFFGEYERWMLERHVVGGAALPSFRDRLRGDVEALAMALRGGGPFAPFRFGEEEKACSMSSATI